MRIPLFFLAAVMILSGNVLIAAIARTIPDAVFADQPGWGVLAALLILVGIGLVLWTNGRHAA